MVSWHLRRATRAQMSARGWQSVQRRLLLELGRDNVVARSVPPPFVLRWMPGAPYPTTVATHHAREERATLAVAPNPLDGDTMMHPATVTWDTGDGSIGEVWVSRDGGPEKMLVRGAGGTHRIASLAATSGYLFNVYTGENATVLRRSLTLLPAPSASHEGDSGRIAPLTLTTHLAWRLVHQRLHLRWYDGVVPALLGRFPRPVWRIPASIGASIRMVCDGKARALARGLAGATGSASWSTRWRLRWAHCYHYEAEQLLAGQTEALSREWVERSVTIRGALPPDGAILISVHHLLRWLSYLRLGIATEEIGSITMEPQPDQAIIFVEADPIIQRRLRALQPLRERIAPWRDFYWHTGSREVLRFLRSGGYAVFMIDVFIDGWSLRNVFNKKMPIPQGPIWFAERTNKPIIPFMLIPTHRGWELRIGEPIEPTLEALAAALERCVRDAPGMWRRDHASAWLRADREALAD